MVAGWVVFLWLPAAIGITGAPTLLPALAITAWLLVLLAGAEEMRVRREQPEQARTALAAINDASAEALREVRSVLGVLRGNGEQPPRTPTAGLARLDGLVSRAEAAGVQVSLDISGEQRPLPARIDLAAFRIVQESLTNIIRHAGSGTATVTLAYGGSELTVQVDDDGRGATSSRSGGGSGAGEAGNWMGSGIVGMRERAAVLGGSLDAGPLPAGGFRVRARLPLSLGTA